MRSPADPPVTAALCAGADAYPYPVNTYLASGLQAEDSIDARVERVSQGLRPPVSFVGDSTWSLAERMAHYGVRGFTITDIEGSAVAWTRVYGLADRETGAPVRETTLFQAGSISKPVGDFRRSTRFVDLLD